MKLSLSVIVALVLTVVAVVAFLLLPGLVFGGAATQYELFFSQKIFYYHVPAGQMMYLSVFITGIASIGFLKTRNPAWDDVASAAADLAVVLGAMVLTSGPIWGKVAWGVWWVWDARLTQSLLLWMIFLAYALVRRYGGLGSERLCAGLAVFGMVDVPLGYFAVNFWRTQHPTNKVVPNLPPSMMKAFLTGILAYFALYIVLLLARIAVGRGQRRLAAVTDLAVELGRLE